jgi:hypothetical protein
MWRETTNGGQKPVRRSTNQLSILSRNYILEVVDVVVEVFLAFLVLAAFVVVVVLPSKANIDTLPKSRDIPSARVMIFFICFDLLE